MHDVLVVGAGPAGNNAAYQLSSMGYDVAVVDQRTVIGDKLCSGIVGVECLNRFPAEDSHIIRPASSAEVTGPSGATLEVAHPETQAYVLDRVSYVASFAEKARRSGASYILGHKVQSLDVLEDGVRARIANGGPPKIIEARSAVLASGFGSRFTRALGLGQVTDYTIGVQAEVEAPKVSRIQVFVGKRVAPGFFAWLVPTFGGKALLGLLARKEGSARFKSFLSRLVGSGAVKSVVTPPARWGIPMGRLKRAYRDRVLVAGDAAGHVKPTTGGGIYYSLLTSEIAARTLNGAFKRGDLSARSLSGYESEWTDLLGAELRIGDGARQVFEMFGDRQIDFLIEQLKPEEGSRSPFDWSKVSFDWHSAVLKRLLFAPAMRRALRFAGAVLPRAR